MSYTDYDPYHDFDNYHPEYQRLRSYPRDFRVSHNHYGGGGAPITFVMCEKEVKFLRSSRTDSHGEQHLMNVVNGILYEAGARYPGTVHSWTYCNGDVRFTFQPKVR